MPGRRERNRELVDTIEALAAAIAMNAREEKFFRRNGEASRQQEVREVLLAVAEDFCACRTRLESGHDRLTRVLSGGQPE